MEKKKYNLRSARAESVQIPIQVQLSDDSEFFNLLGDTSIAHQDLNDSSNSDSDLDLSAVVAGSDSDDVSTQSFDRLQSDKPSTSAAVSDQTLVNQQILAQLSAIGTRLDKLEQKKSSKNQNRPKVQVGVLRVKVKVLLSKAHTHMIILPENLVVEVLVKNRVKWPHEYVLV